VLEYLREEKLRCPGCGNPVDETMDPVAEEHWRGVAMRCHACAARDREAERFSKQPHQAAGLYFIPEKR
jgi:uncharacterized Zn finger protein